MGGMGMICIMITLVMRRQVEDCTRDVCELSTYHFRYRICNVHIRLPAFMRQGKLQRFCQQCGRCHELSEFEGNQRSCRAQLDRHNARCLFLLLAASEDFSYRLACICAEPKSSIAETAMHA
jgi:hypothetical protein